MRLTTGAFTKFFEDFTFNADISVDEGEFVCLLGPSGCGKTTALQLIAGILAPDSGEIRLGNRDITAMPPWERNIGLVFQDYALFPHMNVQENIAYGLKQKSWSRGEIKSRVDELLRLVRLPNYQGRKPEHLSGGEKQRVALARAIAPSPDLLLMDEPLSALDAGLRTTLRREIRRIQRRVGLTTIYVTHDQEEALTLGDRIIVMRNGGIEQQGTPQELYHNPTSSFVATFIGKANLLPISNGTTMGSIPGSPPSSGERGRFYFFRPEDTILSCTAVKDSRFFALPLLIDTVEYVGSHYIVEGSKNGISLRAHIDEKRLADLHITEGKTECWFSVERTGVKVLSK